MLNFQRIAILGTGLIGGSFGLAVRRALPQASVTGWDRPAELAAAAARGAIASGSPQLRQALDGADLVFIALPIGVTIDLLPQVARHAAPGALVTDACSVKAAIERVARPHFGGASRFLGGHPLAGKETSGIANADAELFCGAPYALAASPEDPDLRVRGFALLLERIHSRPVWVDAEAHDRAVALVSHLPQLLAVALAGTMRAATDEAGVPLTLAGPGVRDMLRLAGGPYAMWRDICLANRQNISAAIERLAQQLDHLRAQLASRELEAEFDAANEVYKILRQIK